MILTATSHGKSKASVMTAAPGFRDGDGLSQHRVNGRADREPGPEENLSLLLWHELGQAAHLGRRPAVQVSKDQHGTVK